MAAGTRTAPAFTATATRRVITLHLIDASGDYGSEDWVVPLAATAAAIEAWAAAYANTSQSSLYGITERNERFGIASVVNATTGARDSIKDGINLRFGNNTTLISRSLRVVAPEATTMSGQTDIPVVATGTIDALITATIAISTAADYFGDAQYTERRERRNNPRVGA